MIRLFASDLDGTLLDNARAITQENITAIKKLQDAGIEFIINTGREYPNVERIKQEAGLTCGTICTNGSSGHDADGNLLFEASFTMDQVKQVFQAFHEFNVVPNVFADAGRITTLSEKDFDDYMESDFIPAVQVNHTDFVYDKEVIKKMLEGTIYLDGDEALFSSDYHVLKIAGNTLQRQTILELRKRVEQIPGLVAVSTVDTDLEVTSEDAQKGIALMKYAELKGYKLDEIVAIGDSENDYSMLNLPDIHSVAMENAADMVKEVCTYLTKANTKDGVAYIIKCILEDEHNFQLL